MAAGRGGFASNVTSGKSDVNSGARPVDLEGDSPELVAFALLRYLAQLEQPRAASEGIDFNRAWLLDAYAECLEAVRGLRPIVPNEQKVAPAPAKGKAAKR
jgi:hypothetical protein